MDSTKKLPVSLLPEDWDLGKICPRLINKYANELKVCNAESRQLRH